MFTSLRSKLSRKEKDHKPAPQQYQHQHQQTTWTPPTVAPPTRRPQNSYVTNDAPPAYSAAPNSAPSSLPTPQIYSQSPADDPYAFLSIFDTVFLIDDSGSMAGSRWRETAEALETITPICTAHDADGIDVYFLNAGSHPSHSGITTSAGVRAAFASVRPYGATPTGQRLMGLLKPYVRRYQAAPQTTKPLNLICITDGAASDDVESVVLWVARTLDSLDAPAWQVGIQFFQVGRDPEASADLAALDDELHNASAARGGVPVRDIVDTVPFRGDDGERLTGDGILKVVLGGVVRRLDRKPVRLH